MGNYYLAVDIGASGGRHILAEKQGNKLLTEEVYRFDNEMVKKNGHLCWDVKLLFEEIKTGMKKCRELGKIPLSMGIDTWGVDFVLLDENERMLGDAVAYRDRRTEGVDRNVYKKISEADLYARTGIQKQDYNTIYQLEALKEQEPELLEKAEAMLLLPDYLHFLLCGVKKTEYTIATTTQLIDPRTRDWDWELIGCLGFPERIFQEIVPAGTVLGELNEELQREVGFSCEVTAPAAHDTGSAVLAVPSNDEKAVYLSSGTWSLMGVERPEPDCSEKSRELNFTNEGGYAYRYRYLKNIMGLWMIQSVKKEYHDRYSFGEFCTLAESCGIASIVDCNDASFLSPDSMCRAIAAFCEKSGQEIPGTPGEFARVIYRSLAAYYRDTIREIEDQVGFRCDKIHVVGGGANADYLNRLTVEMTGKRVLAGPIEATAVGNLMAQMLSHGEWASLQEARDCVRDSFAIKEYH